MFIRATVDHRRRFAMLSKFQRQKLYHLFNQYDINQDGELGRVDFEIAAKALTQAFDLSEDSAEASNVYRSYIEYWSYLQRYMDRNLDKCVSSSEFIERFEFMARQPESVETLIFSTSEYIVQLTDLDGDGIINRAEYVQYLIAHNVDVDDANRSFDLLDQNRSNTLTKDEILNSVRTFLTSDDPLLPGNALFGTLGEG